MLNNERCACSAERARSADSEGIGVLSLNAKTFDKWSACIRGGCHGDFRGEVRTVCAEMFKGKNIYGDRVRQSRT